MALLNTCHGHARRLAQRWRLPHASRTTNSRSEPPQSVKESVRSGTLPLGYVIAGIAFPPGSAGSSNAQLPILSWHIYRRKQRQKPPRVEVNTLLYHRIF
jgi:hypothetical protein